MHTITERRIKRLARLNNAAAYVDESRTTYWRHTKAGIWPEPIDVGGIAMVDRKREADPLLPGLMCSCEIAFGFGPEVLDWDETSKWASIWTPHRKVEFRGSR